MCLSIKAHPSGPAWRTRGVRSSISQSFSHPNDKDNGKSPSTSRYITNIITEKRLFLLIITFLSIFANEDGCLAPTSQHIIHLLFTLKTLYYYGLQNY